MSERICPLCGKPTHESEDFCRDCQEIAQKSTLSEIVEDYDSPVQEADGGVSNELERNRVTDNNEELAEGGSEMEDTSSPADTETQDKESAEPSEKPKQPRSSKKLLIFYGVGLVIFTLIGVLSTYQIVKDRQSEETELAYWNQCIEENTPFAYSKYLFRYPEGQFTDQAQAKIMELREKERKEWEELKKSTDLNAYFAFLADHPDTPYAGEIKMLMDSISWQTTVKENTAEAYLAYLDNVKLGHFEGDFQTQAQEKYDYLSQLKTLEGEQLAEIKKDLKEFFRLLQDKQYKKLEPLMAPILIKYYDAENKTKEAVIETIQNDLKENKIKTVGYTLNTDSLDVVQDNKGIYFVTLPVKKEVTYTDRKKKKELRHSTLSLELNDKKQLQALSEKNK